jgi:hypothetical protein
MEPQSAIYNHTSSILQRLALKTKFAKTQSRAIPQDSEEGPFKDGN